jgi:hypothetical protein
MSAPRLERFIDTQLRGDPRGTHSEVAEKVDNVNAECKMQNANTKVSGDLAVGILTFAF